MADQLQREIEDILNKLDEFIPEQKKSSRIRKRWAKIGGAGASGSGASSRVSRWGT